MSNKKYYMIAKSKYKLKIGLNFGNFVITNKNTIYRFSSNGHYLIELYLPDDESLKKDKIRHDVFLVNMIIINKILSFKKFKDYKYIVENINDFFFDSYYCCMYGNLNMLQHIYKHEIFFVTEIDSCIKTSIKFNNINIIKWIHCFFNINYIRVDYFWYAIFYDNLNVLKWMYKNLLQPKKLLNDIPYKSMFLIDFLIENNKYEIYYFLSRHHNIKKIKKSLINLIFVPNELNTFYHTMDIKNILSKSNKLIKINNSVKVREYEMVNIKK